MFCPAPGLSRDVLADAIKAMDRLADESVGKVDRAAAERMVNEPWRITRAVFGTESMYSGWPIRNARGDLVEGMTAPVVFKECHRRLDNMRGLGRAGHYAYDSNRLAALRQAEMALLAIIDAETSRDAAKLGRVA